MRMSPGGIHVGQGWPIEVSDHAMWRAAERFPGFATERIEWEVRAAIQAGRITTDRGTLGLHPVSDPASLYVWTKSGRRIYALRVERIPPMKDQKWIVTTTMRRTDHE